MRPVVLAAGASSRMGHPKALTRLAGEPALARVLRALRDAGLAEPVVVLGHHADEVRRAVDLAGARVVLNPDPDAGRTGSLQRALGAVATDAILLWPVDHPLPLAATARAVADAPGEWVAPTWGGRRGHPVALRGRALDAVRAAPPGAPLRDVLRGAGLAPRVVEVADAGVLANLDTPADLPDAKGI